MRAPPIAFALLVALSCNRKPEPSAGPPPASGGPVAQVRIGDGPEPPRLGFAITATYENQAPGTAPPWHSAGGDWTFFDATTDDGAAFVFGIHAGKSAKVGNTPMSFGEGVLATKDRDSGARFAGSFSHAFHVDLPPPSTAQKAPVALKASTVVLADDAKRVGAGGGFGGTGGGWTAMKWTFEHESGEEEVFFNFSRGAKQGELSEKDQEYDPDLAKDFAGALRDGTFR